MENTLPERIDVHSHAIPPKYRQYLLDNGHEHPDGMPAIPPWDPETHISLMKTRNITHTILSISSPGTNLTPASPMTAVITTRSTNTELSAICKSYPKQFSFFASLPLPLIPESIKEIDHALDTLGAKGFCLMSNFHGQYLGDPIFSPVLQKLNSRKAVLFIHPTTCNLVLPSFPSPTTTTSSYLSPSVHPLTPLPYPNPMLEFMFDSTRLITSLLLSAIPFKYPDIKFILSHAGCTLPPVIDRIGAFSAIVHGAEDEGENFKRVLRERFWWDLAGKSFPDQIWGLVRLLGGMEGDENGAGVKSKNWTGEVNLEALEKVRKRLFYGSDFPFTPERAVVQLQVLMDEGLEGIFGKDGQADILMRNAKDLFELSG